MLENNDFVTLEEMSVILGWRGHSAYFNTQIAGFPSPAVVIEGEKKYSLQEVIDWDRNRPLQHSEYIETGEMPVDVKTGFIV